VIGWLLVALGIGVVGLAYYCAQMLRITQDLVWGLNRSRRRGQRRREEIVQANDFRLIREE
jgi:hypothetical protein